MLIGTLIYKTIDPIVCEQPFVTIHHDRLEAFALGLGAKDLQLLEQSRHFIVRITRYFSSSAELVRFLFVLNSIGFCFWAKTKEEKWTYFSSLQQRALDGYEGLLYCLLEAYLAKRFSLDGAFLASFSVADGIALFKDTRLPLLERRVAILREIGTTLQRDYQGDFMLFFAQFTTTEELVSSLVEVFPSYHDASVYAGRQVIFLKRAQLFVSQIMTCCSRDYRLDISQLTALADYKLPQVLESLGIISFAVALAQQIRDRVPLMSNSAEEVALRACTISCCRLIREKTRLHLNDIDVNHLLWHRGQQALANPYFLVLTDKY